MGMTVLPWPSSPRPGTPDLTAWGEAAAWSVIRQSKLLRYAGLNPPIKHIRRCRDDRDGSTGILRHESKPRPILPDLHISHRRFHQKVHLKDARHGAGQRGELRYAGGAGRRLVSEKIDRAKITRRDPIPLRCAHIEGDAAVPRAHHKLTVGPGQRVTMQNRFVADDFRETVGIVIDEIDFGKAADFELEPALPLGRLGHTRLV